MCAPGDAPRWWLHQSLAQLAESLARLDSKLFVLRGLRLQTLRALIRATRADSEFWNQQYEPETAEQDRHVGEDLREDGMRVGTFNAMLFFEPSRILNQLRHPSQVFSAYWRAVSRLAKPRSPFTAPRQLPAPRKWPASLPLDEVGLQPSVDWVKGMRAAWKPGERNVHQQLRRFLTTAFTVYPTGCDRPDRTGTSRLSPHLHSGEVSPRQVWHPVRARQARSRARGAAAAEAYLRELDRRHHERAAYDEVSEVPAKQVPAGALRGAGARAPVGRTPIRDGLPDTDRGSCDRAKECPGGTGWIRD